MNPEIFREYDIRGIAATDLKTEDMELIGKAYGTLIHNSGGKTVVVGNDNRESGPRILEALKKGILSTGINIIYIGEIPTPLLYYAVHKLNADGGISVTASHNPPEFNGFKVMIGKDAIFGEKIREIGTLAESGDFVVGKGSYEEKSLDETYLEEIVSIVNISRKPKFVIDAGNGMASEIAPKLFEKLGLNPTCLFCEKDSGFPNHIADPTQEKNMRDLREKVLEEKAEFGIAFDGDVDRIGIVDEKGTLIFGDKLLGVFAKDVLQRNPNGKVVFEVKCSQALEEWIRENNGVPIMWKTGHSLIKAKMKEEKAVLAGEMSGHMFFTENWYGFDDALLAAVRLIEIISKSDKKVSEIINEMPSYAASPELRIDCEDKKKESVVREMTEKYKEKYPESVTIDGIRIKMENGWALVRKSNTQPKIILRFEAKNSEELDKITRLIKPEVEALIESK